MKRLYIVNSIFFIYMGVRHHHFFLFTAEVSDYLDLQRSVFAIVNDSHGLERACTVLDMERSRLSSGPS